MKAVVVEAFSGIDQVGIGQLEDPLPAAGEVVVTLSVSDTNFPDILYIEGGYQSTPPFPFSPGLGGVGRVTALGEGVDNLHEGQRVLVLPEHGTYAEKVVAVTAHCFPVPDAVPSTVAAALGLVYQTAWFALTERARLRAGETVLVLGASGGIGMAAVQLARALGAGRVIAATRGDDGAAFARDIGADVVIDSNMEDLKGGLKAAVAEATDGYGADIVIDGVGGDLSAAALRALAWCGRLVVVGFAAGAIPKIGANYLLVKNIEASGLQWTDYRSRRPDQVREAQASIFALWQEGALAPRLNQTLPLARFSEALTALRDGRHRGKTLLVISEDEETR